MKRWLRILVPLTILAALITLFSIPVTRYVILGWVHREPFAEGRPASWWAYKLNWGTDEESKHAHEVLLGMKGEAVPALLGELNHES